MVIFHECSRKVIFNDCRAALIPRRHGIDQRNFNGRMLLKFCLEKELCVKYMV